MLDLLPQLLIVGLNDLGGGSSQITEHIFGKSGLDSLVTAMQLGPCLLEQDDPKFISVSLRKGGVSLEARDVVIDDDFLPLAILADFKAVDAQIVLLVSQEKFLDTMRILRKDREDGEEVAISKQSLLDVGR